MKTCEKQCDLSRLRGEVDEDSLNRTRDRVAAAVRKERILRAWKTKNEVDGDRSPGGMLFCAQLF